MYYQRLLLRRFRNHIPINNIDDKSLENLPMVNFFFRGMRTNNDFVGPHQNRSLLIVFEN